MALAREDAQSGQDRAGPAESGDGHQHAGVLAQVRAAIGMWRSAKFRSKATSWSPTRSGPPRLCDENTIGVVSVLGSTFTGDYENVAALSAALDRLQEKTGLDIPIHVDGASGGFVAPFLQPELTVGFPAAAREVDQYLGPQIRPGLSGRGLGRSGAKPSDLHPDLIFNVDYLGGTMPTLAINFSRPASQVVAQYYNLIRLGKSGYRAIHQACQEVAVHLARQIAELGPFRAAQPGHGSSGVRVDAEGAARTGRCTIWPTGCAIAAGRCPLTACPPTARSWWCSAWWCATASLDDLADMLVRDIRRHLDWFAAQPGLKPKVDGGAVPSLATWKGLPIAPNDSHVCIVAAVCFPEAIRQFVAGLGHKTFSAGALDSPVVYLHAMLDPFVALGIAMLILSLFTRLALLSLADLSFMLPVTAIGYVLAALFGKLFLHEDGDHAAVARNRADFFRHGSGRLDQPEHHRLSGENRMKWLLLSIVVTATALSDLLQSYEMKRAGEQSIGARGIARLLKIIVMRRELILSIVCLAISFFAFMALVQAEPLSFAVPASAASFILETLLAKLVLKERSACAALPALCLVLGGIVLLAR